MFIIIQSWLGLALLFGSLAVFGVIAWRRLDFGLVLVLFLAPLYFLKISQLPLTVLELFVLTLVAIWLIKKTKTGWAEIFATLKGQKDWFLGSILILAGVFAAAFISVDLKTSAGILKAWFIEPMVIGLIVLDTVKTPRQIKKLLLAIVFSSFAVALVGIIYWLVGQRSLDGRLSAFYLSPNQLAMFLSPALILSLIFWFEAQKKWQRALLLIVQVFLLITLYFTFSYAAWLAILIALALAMGLIWHYQILKSKKRVWLGLIGLLAVFLCLFYFQIGTIKMNNLLADSRSSWQSRLMIWQAAGKILADHWFLGIGPGLFQKYYLEYQKYFPPYLEWAVPQPHNLFLAFWLQTGLLGIIGFLWLIISFFQRAFEVLAKTKQPLILILTAALVYVLAHGLLDTTYWKNDLALVFWVIISLGYIAIRLRD